MIVIDASATIALVFNEDGVATTFENFRIVALGGVIAPSHWPAEVGNALVSNVRRRRLQPRHIEFVIERLGLLKIAIESTPDFVEMTSIVEMAINFGLSYYDAAYVHKAQSRQATLFTFDRRMRETGARLNIPVMPA